MNTILQKRIEEAANITVQNLYDCARQMRNPEVSKYDEGYLDAIALQGDFLFREGANYALSNQWISVEEALPEENGIYFVLINSKAPHITTFTDKWNIGNNTYNITHWMKIPSLKGGEK